jgi:regulator of replication initiation timing
VGLIFLNLRQFEADIANLHKSLERSKTQYSSMVKLHQEQTTTSEELRNAIREKDLEAVAARETIDGLRSDADKVQPPSLPPSSVANVKQAIDECTKTLSSSAVVA